MLNSCYSNLNFGLVDSGEFRLKALGERIASLAGPLLTESPSKAIGNITRVFFSSTAEY